MLKTSGNILPVLAGSYVVFWVLFPVDYGSSSVFPTASVSDIICQTFLLAVVELPFWGLLAFQFHKFPEILCLAGIFGFILAFFLWSHTRQYELLARNFRQSRDDSEEHALLLSEKTRRFWKNRIMRSMLATLRERNRIAREIHDNVGHVLSRSILMTACLQNHQQR